MGGGGCLFSCLLLRFFFDSSILILILILNSNNCHDPRHLFTYLCTGSVSCAHSQSIPCTVLLFAIVIIMCELLVANPTGQFWDLAQCKSVKYSSAN